MSRASRGVKERSVEEELVRRVRAMGGLCYKAYITGVRGFPDRLVVLPGGRVVFVECKRPTGGVVSAHQTQLLDKLAGLGAEVAFIKNSYDIDRLLAAAIER